MYNDGRRETGIFFRRIGTINPKTHEMKRSCIANHLALLRLVVTGCATFRPVTGQQADDQMVAGRLTIASCQFPVSADIDENARWIEKQMRAAAERGAHVVHFPECALSGYPGVDLKSLEG